MISLSTWSLHRLLFDHCLSLPSLPAFAGSMGFEGVELEDIWFHSTDQAFLETLSQEANKAGVTLSLAISNDFTVPDRGALRKQIRHVLHFLGVGKALGSEVVRILAGRARADGNALKQVRDTIREILPAASELGLRLAIENHDRLTRNPDVLADLLDEIGSPGPGVCLDFGNLNARTRYSSIKALAPKALVVHAKTYAFRPNGEERTISFRRCFSILRESGFRGPVVVEYDGRGDQLHGSLRTLKLVRKHWSNS